jgi:hypothetical protein
MRATLIGLLFCVLAGASAHAATTFTKIEEKSGWKWCTGCAGAGGNAKMSMSLASSPTLDGISGKFFLGGSTPWSHSLYHRRMSNSSSPTHFVLDFDYYFKNPSASSAMEFSVSEVNGKNWYRWDTQCSYLSKIWRVWDGKNMKWLNTSVPCPRPASYKWNHVTFEAKRADGKTVFVSITLNGKKYYINKAVGPTYLGYYDPNVGIHFQLNGNAYQTDYYVWGDKFKLTYW